MRIGPGATQLPEMGTADVEVLVVGAGVVGLACAADAARAGRSVVIVDRHAGPGRETSSRNSGVIHAGLYYPEGSLRAATCVEGRRLLYERCRARDIPHRKTGKLVVAVHDEEVPALERILARGRAAGVEGLEIIDAAELHRREPLLAGVAALWSPESGIVDAHALMDSYLAEAREHGAEAAWHTEVTALDPGPHGCRVRTRDASGSELTVRAEWVVNAAGLSADRVAALAGIDVDAAGWRLHLCKGDYFALAPPVPRPSTALVYPVPAGPGLGVHLTVDLGGQCLAGPDARYVDHIDYDVDPSRAHPFAQAVARYLPHVTPDVLSPAYSGIRPKLAPPGGGFRDFVLADGADHGAPRTIHLVGIESPGLTASGALARRVSAIRTGSE